MSAYRKLPQIYATTCTRNCKTSIHFFLRIFQRDLDCYRRNIKRHCYGPVWPVNHEYFLRQHDAPYQNGGGLKFYTFVVIRAWLRFLDSYLLLELYHIIDFCVSFSLFGSFLFIYIVYRMTVLIHFSENFSYFTFLIITCAQNYFKNIVLLHYNVTLSFSAIKVKIINWRR